MEFRTPERRGLSRRSMLSLAGGGFGLLPLASLLADENSSEEMASGQGARSRREQTAATDSSRPSYLHRRPGPVRRVIQLFMTGGASPMDTFDPKPELTRLHGQNLGPKIKPEGFTAMPGAIMKSPFEFKQYGETGRWVSSVFPHQARCVDDMAFLMAMASKTNVHGPATYMMNTGFLLPGFPCLGAWVSYALGSIVDNLPTFVVLPDSKGLPYNQKGPFSAGFLPSRHQGTVINAAAAEPVPDLFAKPRFPFVTRAADRDGLELLRTLDRGYANRLAADDSRLESRIAACELAAKMQLSEPEAFDIGRETSSTIREYGLETPATQDFGRRCLIARRLVERGVRFVQVWSGPQGATGNWDNHGSIPNELPPIALSVDQPIGALLRDLKSRGLFSDTLLVWTTEFGRTPFAQGSTGRDHNGGSFVTWLAGAGIRAGATYGQSDEWGYQAVEGRTYCYDLHATLLHLLGIDHERLTVRQNGIDRRLTDVHGRVIREVLS